MTLIESDNRIAAFDADSWTHDLAAPEEGGLITVTAPLIFRRISKVGGERKPGMRPTS